MGSFLFSFPVPVASMHTQCSLSDVISHPCLQMFYSDGFFFFFLSQLHPKCVCFILDSSFFFLFLNPLKGFGSEFSKGVYKIQQWVLQVFLIEHEISRKRSLIRIFHIIISHFVLQRQYTQKKTHCSFEYGKHQLF